jgi:hypothetical protein
MSRAWKPRFRLRTLLIAVALCAAAFALVSESSRYQERQRRLRHLQAARAALGMPLTLRLDPPATLGTFAKVVVNLAPGLYLDANPEYGEEVRAALRTPVTLDVDGTPVGEVLTRLLGPLGLTHRLDADGRVILTSKAAQGVPAAD